MIEAMARGLPCIGSTVGGIPELLTPEEMVQPNDAQALADKIQQVVTNPTRMSEMSARNLKKASEYHESLLRKRRNEFYQYVKDKTLEWRCR
jgi:glycosyltransferase involved in cell wall biosynthesis